MKHRIISTTIRLAAIAMATVAAVACRVEDGSGNIDSTAVGYTLFNNANDAMQEFSQAIDRMQGLDLYIGAADDTAREAIRNRFFYDKRIVPDADNEGVWYIISESTGMEVDTGRKRLGDEGAVWSYSYIDRKYADGKRPTLRRTAQGSYLFSMPAPADTVGDFLYAVADGLEVKLTFEPDDPLKGYSTIILSGRFTSFCGYGPQKLVLEVEIGENVTYSAEKSGTTGGRMTLDGISNGSVDRAAASYLTPHTVEIEYEGNASTWVY